MTIDSQRPTADPLIERVRKLLDKAEGTTNPHEAELFARKAAELVAANRIDPQRIERADTTSELGVRRLAMGRGAYVRARLSLLTNVADAHDVRVAYQTGPDGMIAYAAGFESDLQVVEAMYASLHQQAAQQMNDIRRSTPAATQRWRRSFLFGFAARIGDVLADARAQVEEAPAAATALPALRARCERIDEHAAEAFGPVRSARPARAAHATAWKAGVAAANGADVGRARLAGRQAIGRG
ncbi:MAG: DUF2786 domain-containing protein [Ilumatobacteraceae bacterium]|nr:DUF2786 domain-containing protein [Ilumatobacteraceae bacterium]